MSSGGSITSEAQGKESIALRFPRDSKIVQTNKERVPAAVAPRPFELLVPFASSEAIELTLTSLLSGETEAIQVDTPLIVIGRGSQCDLRLTHHDVSRRHACIHFLRDRALCVDLGSRTGVFWGEECRQVGWLDPHQPVRIGPFELQLVAPSLKADDLHPEAFFRRHSFEELTFQRAGLRFLNQGIDVPPVPLARPITLVGRAEQCKLRLRDESVSRVHSSLMLTSEGVWIADLLGRGGVRVNGEYVSIARLTTGDELQIGRYRMVFADDLPDIAGKSRDHHSENAAWSASRTAACPREGITESLLLAITETFAEMQRQMNEQFRLQMEMMIGLVESSRREMNEEVRAELARLATIGEEIRESQRQLISHALSVPASTLGSATTTTSPEESRRTTKRKTGSQAIPPTSDGVADHVYVTRRLRELERERSSRWMKLAGLLKQGR